VIERYVRVPVVPFARDDAAAGAAAADRLLGYVLDDDAATADVGAEASP
jgi:hypothetical protein